MRSDPFPSSPLPDVCPLPQVCATHPSMGVFVSEICHPDWRSSLGVVPSIFLELGITMVWWTHRIVKLESA